MTTSKIVLYFGCTFVGLIVGMLCGFVIGIVYKDKLEEGERYETI